MKVSMFLMGFSSCGIAYRIDHGMLDDIWIPASFLLLSLVSVYVHKRKGRA